MSYYTDAQSDASNMIDYFKDEIIEQLLDDGEASDDLFNDYPDGDSYHHESHVDKDYDLTDAAAVLDELYAHEETDSGIWQGLAPREAIGAQAAYTYGNAVYSLWRDMIEKINEEFTDNLEAQKEDMEQAVAEWTCEQCAEYIKANPDCVGDLDDLDSSGEAIIEHWEEANKKRVATETVDGVTAS